MKNSSRRIRVRFRLSCQVCRKRKRKCDNEQPCRRCEKNGVECIRPEKRRKYTSSKQKVEELTRKNNTLEERQRSMISKVVRVPPDISNFIRKLMYQTDDWLSTVGIGDLVAKGHLN